MGNFRNDDEKTEFSQILNEIKRHKENVFVKHTSIYRNKENVYELKIIINTKNDLEEIESPWPSNAFMTGIKLIRVENVKWLMRVEGVSRDFKYQDEREKEFMRKQYGIIDMSRKVFSDGSLSSAMRIEVSDKKAFMKLIETGVYIKSYHCLVKPWEFKPKFCYKCCTNSCG